MKALKKGVWIAFGCLTVLAVTSAARAAKQEVPVKPEMIMSRDPDRLTIEGANFRYAWQLSRGGELSRVEVHDGSQWVSLMDPGQTIPDLRFENDKGTEFRVNLGAVKQIQMLKETEDEISFRTSCVALGKRRQVSPWRVYHTYRVFRVGVVFCDLKVELIKGFQPEVKAVRMGLFLSRQVTRAPKFRWGYDRVYIGDEDRAPEGLYLPAEVEREFNGEFYPLVGAAFGLSSEAGFTNRVDFVVEEGKPFVPQEPSHFRMRFGTPPGEGMQFEWSLHDGPGASLNPPFVYRNRWGIAVTGARTSNAPGTPRVRKNKLIGQRIFHWLRWSVGEGRFGSAAWYPTDLEIDQIAALGTDILLLHHGWMRSGGRGRRLAADYQPGDPRALRRVIDRCHAKSIRVGLYMRGLEYFILDRDTAWFDDFLTVNYDGVYVDWSSVVYPPSDAYPDAVPVYGEDLIHRQGSPTRVSALTTLLYTRKLRELVGEDGFVIVHVGNKDKEPDAFSVAYFDAILAGEAHLRYLSSPDENSYFCPGNGCNSWCPKYPETRSQRALAYYAAFGNVPHVVAGKYTPEDPTDPVNRFAAPYWGLLANMDMSSVDLRNNLSESRIVSSAANPCFHSSMYQSRDHLLLLVSYLPDGQEDPPVASTEIRINPVLPAPSDRWQVTELVPRSDGSIQRMPSNRLTDGTVRAQGYQPYEFRGYLIKPRCPTANVNGTQPGR